MEREKEKNRVQMKRNGICLPIRPDTMSDVEKTRHLPEFIQPAIIGNEFNGSDR